MFVFFHIYKQIRRKRTLQLAVRPALHRRRDVPKLPDWTVRNPPARHQRRLRQEPVLEVQVAGLMRNNYAWRVPPYRIVEDLLRRLPRKAQVAAPPAVYGLYVVPVPLENCAAFALRPRAAGGRPA